MALVPRRTRAPSEREMGLLRRNVAAVAQRISGASTLKQMPGTDAGWGRPGYSSGELTSRIRSFIDTYGGDSPVTWVYACVTTIMDEMALYPYVFVDPDTAPDLGRCTQIDYKKVPSDLKDLLREPNRFMTWFDFINFKSMDEEIGGNSYWLKDRMNNLGQPKALLRLRPEYTRIATNRRGEIVGYVYSVQGAQLAFDIDEILHFKRPSPHSEYYGMGVLQGILPDVGIEFGVNEHVIGFFVNGARISGILTIDGTLQEDQFERIKRQFREEYGGSGNAFSVLIAEQGTEFRPLTQPPASSGVKEIAELSKDKILSGFGLHAEMLGGSQSPGDVKAADVQRIMTRKMRPRARRTSERMTYSIVGQWGQIGIWIDTSEVEAMEIRISRARDMLGAGGTVNEARQEMGEPTFTAENFPGMEAEWYDLANVPILPSGYEPFYINQQGTSPGGFDDVLPGGSNGNNNGSSRPTAPAGAPDRARTDRSVRGGKQALALPSGKVVGLPEGMEDLGDYELSQADPEVAETLLELQADVYREEMPAWENEMVQFFNDQRGRVLRAMETFGTESEARRTRKQSKKELTIDRIWTAPREDDLLDSLYRVRSRGVAQRTVNEIAEQYGTASADIRGIVDEIASKVVSVNKTTRERIQLQIAEGIRRGYSVDQIANGYPEENYIGIVGVFDSATETRARTIARTEVARVHNLASVSGYKQLGVGRVEVLDGQTDLSCAEARGQIWTIEQAMADPIAHPNCVRSFIPVMAGTTAA